MPEEEKRRYSYWIGHPRDTNYIPGCSRASFLSFPQSRYQTYLLHQRELLHLDGAMHRPAYCSNPKM